MTPVRCASRALETPVTATDSAATSTARAAAPAAVEPDPLRWKALIVIALTQLMVVLDASIVNIALPSIQADLGISDTDRQWAITAYAQAFGSVLLLGSLPPPSR